MRTELRTTRQILMSIPPRRSHHPDLVLKYLILRRRFRWRLRKRFRWRHRRCLLRSFRWRCGRSSRSRPRWCFRWRSRRCFWGRARWSGRRSLRRRFKRRCRFWIDMNKMDIPSFWFVKKNKSSQKNNLFFCDIFALVSTCTTISAFVVANT